MGVGGGGVGDAFRALPGLKYRRGKELRMSQRGRGWRCRRVKVCTCILLTTSILSGLESEASV